MNPIYKFFLNKGSGNEIAPGLISKGVVINASTGKTTVASFYQTTAFMPVTASLEYIFRNSSGQPTTIPYYAYYNKNKAFVSGGVDGGTLTIPTGVAFIRISFLSSLNAEDYCFARSNVGYSQYVSEQVFPMYSEDLAKTYEKEMNEVFFRTGLSGDLTFVARDYDWIVSQVFDFKFLLTIYVSHDAGQTWDAYWMGVFYKTDCTFDGFEKTVVVRPEAYDQYTDFLPLLEREFNIVNLAPDIRRTYIDKPAVLQVYNAGDSVITCIIPGRSWEQECDIVNANDSVAGQNRLTEYLHFAALGNVRTVQISGSDLHPVLPSNTFSGPVPRDVPPVFSYSTPGATFRCTAESDGQGGYIYTYEYLIGTSAYWRGTTNAPANSVTLQPIAGTAAEGIMTATMTDSSGLGIYARLLTDAATVSGQQTLELPADDIVSTRRTHGRVLPYSRTESFNIGQYYTTTPTKYGMYDSTRYYAEPPGDGYLPVVRNKWDANSYWFKFASADIALFNGAMTIFELLINYNLFSVLQRLLTASGSGIAHLDSHFFGDSVNPISGEPQMGYAITPKSNVMAGGSMTYYAQKGDLSLRDFFDLMRDCFRCYWYIDETDRLHIEHIRYFMNGGSYSGVSYDGIDLTALYNPRSSKALAYGQEQYKFDKPAMAARYTFAWMDEVTQPFTGYPIEIVSNYVDKTKSEEIKLSKFTSDIDYLLLAGDIDKDGFAVMNTEESVPFYKVPYWNGLQNGFFSFDYLQEFYIWDMPAKRYSIDDIAYVALGVKRLKLQDVNFPALDDPDPMKLVRTLLGYGKVEKLTVSLSSRNVKATLAYDTE